jgi:hypothetical protein
MNRYAAQPQSRQPMTAPAQSQHRHRRELDNVNRKCAILITVNNFPQPDWGVPQF